MGKPQDLGPEVHGRHADRESMAAGKMAAIVMRRVEEVLNSSSRSRFPRLKKEKLLFAAGLCVEEDEEFREILVPRRCWAHFPNLTGRCVGG